MVDGSSPSTRAIFFCRSSQSKVWDICNKQVGVPDMLDTKLGTAKPRGRRGRSASYYRHQRFRSIKRKYRLVRWGLWWLPSDPQGRPLKGSLHKGKVHCSCWMCASKTRVLGWRISDQRKLDRLQSSLRESRLEGLV